MAVRNRKHGDQGVKSIADFLTRDPRLDRFESRQRVRRRPRAYVCDHRRHNTIHRALRGISRRRFLPHGLRTAGLQPGHRHLSGCRRRRNRSVLTPMP